MKIQYFGHICSRARWLIECNITHTWVIKYDKRLSRGMAALAHSVNVTDTVTVASGSVSASQPSSGTSATTNTSSSASVISMAGMTGPKKGKSGQQHKDMAEKPTLRHISYIQKRGGESKLIPPALIEVVVLGTGAAGTPRSVFLDMTYFRYLFNCGEGTQRAATEHKMRLSKIKDIFITHKSWVNTGGLLGMGLSLGDMGLPSIKMHGPPNVEKMMTMSKGFSPLMLKIEKREISEGPYEDSAMKIEFIPIHPKYPDMEGEEPAPKKHRRDDDDMSVIYHCQPIRKPRSLEYEKAVDLGVPRGPALGKLKSGETITLEDGRTITPDQVLSEHEIIPPFLVLEVPSADYMESLVGNQALAELQQRGTDGAPQLIIHLSPPEVMALDTYQRWMDAFPSSTRHLVLNSGGSVVSQLAPYEVQAKLNLIHPEIFPLLPHQDKEMEKLADIVPGQRVVPGRACLRFSLRTGFTIKRGFHIDNCVDLNNDAYIAATKENTDFQTALVTTKRQLEAIRSKQDSTGADYPEVLFLGTGSALPNKIRNVSAILLLKTASQCMLLDVGEGTYGQLCRHYGNETPAMLRQLTAVFISHLHADHHMGLIGVVEAREIAFESVGQVAPPLIVIVTWNYRKFLNGIDQNFLPLSQKIKLVPVEWFVKPEEQEKNADACQHVTKALGFTELEFCRMKHPQFPFGIAMMHDDGWKLAYSGDTMPCDNFIQIGKDCDILIHEATMEDELEEDALIKKHSTTSQAIEVGMQMGAKFVLLTHFSQRYAKVPRISPNLTDKVGIAFDNMKVRPRHLPVLPLLLPPLQALFSDELQELDKRAERRQLNKESKRLLKEETQDRVKKIALGATTPLVDSTKSKNKQAQEHQT